MLDQPYGNVWTLPAGRHIWHIRLNLTMLSESYLFREYLIFSIFKAISFRSGGNQCLFPIYNMNFQLRDLMSYSRTLASHPCILSVTFRAVNTSFYISGRRLSFLSMHYTHCTFALMGFIFGALPYHKTTLYRSSVHSCSLCSKSTRSPFRVTRAW